MKSRGAALLILFASLSAVRAQAETPRAVSPSASARVTTAAFHSLPSAVTDAQVRAHVIAPPHVRDVVIEEVNAAKEVRAAVSKAARTFKATPTLDVGAFGTAMHAVLKDSVVGYILQVRKNDKLVYNLIWNWAKAPADGGAGWTENTRMHVASVSKFLTAVAMVKALDGKGLGYDTPIAGYLPTYWNKGDKIDQITFRHLLTHRSGFSTGSSSSDYAFMKQRVAAGVSAVGSYDYENMNFGLCRILIPIVTGSISKSATFIDNAALNDSAWDAVTLYHFTNYMQANVFGPAGVSDVSYAPSGTSALAYAFPNTSGSGWNSGDLGAVAGGAGFRLSTRELLDVLGTVRRKGTVLAPTKAQYLLDNYFGIDQAIDTPAGKIYNKNGSWGTGDGKTEQSVAYFMPGGVEVAVFVNSKIGSQAFSLRGLVEDAYKASLK
jgi:CubicO group peptidase (beta-lactamase class C family)